MSFASIWDEDSNGEPANDTDTDSIDSADIDDLPLGADHEQQQIDINQEHRKLLNQARTRKARETARYNKLKRKLESRFQLKEETSQTEAKDIQLKFLTPLFTDAATHSKTSAFSAPDKQKIVRQRGRAVASVLYQLPNVLQAVLTPDPNDPQRSDVRRILDCVVVDDTSTRIRGADFVPVVHTVMNTIQTVHLRYNDSNDSLKLPTPFVVLPSQKTHDVFMAYTFGLLLSSQGIGKLLKSLFDKLLGSATSIQTLVDRCKWKIQIFVGDALPTNDAVFKFERRLLASTMKEHLSSLMMLRFKCGLHQLCLTRRPVALSIEGYWATLVRLGHLFEQNSFRKQFAVALLQVLRGPEGFQRSSAQMEVMVKVAVTGSNDTKNGN